MKRAAALLLLLWMPLASCRLVRPQFKLVPHYNSPELADTMIRRIVLIPFADEAGAGDQSTAIERAFMQEFEKATSIEIISISGHDAEMARNENPRRTGKYRIETILDLAIRHGADAVLFGSIHNYRAYAPQRLGIRLDLISANSGLALWSCNSQFDLADSEASDTLAAVFTAQATRANDTLTWESAQASPARIASLVSIAAVATYNR